MLCEVAASKFNSEPSATVTTPVLVSIANRPPASSVRLYVTVFVVASPSLADAVIPTGVPLAAFSATLLDTGLASTGVDTEDSLTSLILMVTVIVVNDESLLVARMMISYEDAASRSIASATVTTPVFGSIANRPPASSVSEYVTISVPSASSAVAMTPTGAPMAEFSTTRFTEASLSETALIPPSLTSVIVTLIVCVSVRVPSLTCTVTS